MILNKAKEILGEDGASYSDDQIQGIIDCFNLVIEVGYRQFENQHKLPMPSIRSNNSNEKSL